MNSTDHRLELLIKAYLIAVKVVKHHYFFAFIASAECCMLVLFNVTWSLLRKEGLNEHL